MAYSFCGFIGSEASVDKLARRLSKATIIGLPQGLFVIPMVDVLIEEMNGGTTTETVDGFEYLSKRIETLAAQVSQYGPVAYAEVFLSAGEGDQAGIIWEEGKLTRMISGQEVINSILRQLGTVANNGQDEFLTMGFGLRRFIEDWIEG